MAEEKKAPTPEGDRGPDQDAGKEKLKKEETELERCKREKDEYLDGWKRAKADFINYQKDEGKRAEEIVRFSNGVLVQELLSVLDSFELSFAVSDIDEKTKKGMEIIYSQLKDILNRQGLEPIRSLGEKFDPGLHESLAEVESDKEPGTIVEELSKGWKLNGRVIRPARVKISK